MNSRRFLVRINLKLDAVTCPGVWLCSHGYLEITVKVLGYFFRTGAMEPYFPLLCHDHFKIEGYFKNAESLPQLIKVFSSEPLEITLWQNSRRLAHYDGVLMDLLKQMQPKLQCPHTNTKHLLMHATAAFPGIIAPKIEITSNFFIKDKVLNLCKTSNDITTYAILRKHPANAKSFEDISTTQYQKPCNVQSAKLEILGNNQRRIHKQKTVCHTRDLKHRIKQLSNILNIKSQAGRVSIGSSCSTYNTHTSVGICDIEHDSHQNKTDGQKHEEFCELCRLYREVFLK